ncbi:hypothetical protein ACQKWADRAFT_302265 [Trichoderma austrokoningii]
MNYHLSLDHLNCVSRKISPGATKAVVIPELSRDDSCMSRAGCYYSRMNDIYFGQIHIPPKTKNTMLTQQQNQRLRVFRRVSTSNPTYPPTKIRV